MLAMVSIRNDIRASIPERHSEDLVAFHTFFNVGNELFRSPTTPGAVGPPRVVSLVRSEGNSVGAAEAISGEFCGQVRVAFVQVAGSSFSRPLALVRCTLKAF